MNTANKLTMMRVALIPFFMVALYWNSPNHQWVALIIFAVASLTDLIDGQIARRRDQITDFGKFMDPLADKVLTLAALCYFTEAGAFPGWALLIVIGREFAVTSLRLVAVETGRVIAAGWSGKVKTASTMACIILMLALEPAGLFLGVIVAVIVITTSYSGIEYFVKNIDVIKGLKMK